jgi:hypothetical protein
MAAGRARVLDAPRRGGLAGRDAAGVIAWPCYLIEVPALYTLAMLRGLSPVFGVWLVDQAGTAALAAGSVALLALAWGTLARSRWAWWAGLALIAVAGVSAVITLAATSWGELLALWRLPAYEVRFLAGIPLRAILPSWWAAPGAAMALLCAPAAIVAPPTAGRGRRRAFIHLAEREAAWHATPDHRPPGSSPCSPPRGARAVRRRRRWPLRFTTLRGGQVTIWGQGLYRYDTAFYAAGNRGTDAVMLCLGVPLLIATAVGYSRGSLRAGLLLLGALGYSLYLYATLAFNAAYNSLFLAYVALLSASLFAFIGAFAAVDRDALPARWRPGLPRRGLAAFMFAGGAVTLLLWGEPLVTALLRRQPPPLLVSYTPGHLALDMAVVTPPPSWRRPGVAGRPMGYVMAVRC